MTSEPLEAPGAREEDGKQGAQALTRWEVKFPSRKAEKMYASRTCPVLFVFVEQLRSGLLGNRLLAKTAMFRNNLSSHQTGCGKSY